MSYICEDDTQDWPVVLKHDALPDQNVTNASITSSGDLIVRISPACLDTVFDCATFVDQLFATGQQPVKMSGSPNVSHRPCQVENCVRSNHDQGQDKRSLFKVMNCSGLGVACYPNSEQSKTSVRMDLAPTGEMVALKFRPCQEMVHLPDLAQTVCSACSMVVNASYQAAEP